MSIITFQEGEKIILIKRRHPIIYFFNLVPVGIISLIIIIFAFYVIFATLPSWLINLAEFIPFLRLEIVKPFLIFLLSLTGFICWQIAFTIIVNNYLDCWVVTNLRTLHVELLSFFSRTVSSIPNHKIQDVTVEIHGFLPTLFRYGDLKIQTAGAFQQFVFWQIPEPYKTKEVILDVYEKALRKSREVVIKNGQSPT